MRDQIKKALSRSREIISGGHEVVPTFDIQTPEGGFVILCPLPDAHEIRIARLELVSSFMALKPATSFVFSSELAEPDAVSAVGVSRRSVVAGVQLIERSPLSFSDVHWLNGVEEIGDEIPNLFPRKLVDLSAMQIAALESAIKEFSPDGISKVGT